MCVVRHRESGQTRHKTQNPDWCIDLAPSLEQEGSGSVELYTDQHQPLHPHHTAPLHMITLRCCCCSYPIYAILIGFHWLSADWWWWVAGCQHPLGNKITLTLSPIGETSHRRTPGLFMIKVEFSQRMLYLDTCTSNRS